MATIKSFTDLQQSKKLAEFLPKENADMYWWSSGKRYYIESIDDDDYEEDKDIRAWSLAALLDVLPSATLDSSSDHYYRLHCMTRYTEWYDNPVDACYEMILRLHEQNLL